MPWQQLILESGDLDPETVSAFFEEQGALSVTLVDAADQPLFEPDPGTTPLWSAVRITALFAEEANLAEVQVRLAEQFGAQLTGRIAVQVLEDQDWERV